MTRKIERDLKDFQKHVQEKGEALANINDEILTLTETLPGLLLRKKSAAEAGTIDEDAIAELNRVEIRIASLKMQAASIEGYLARAAIEQEHLRYSLEVESKVKGGKAS